jgi:hypothetical protein
MTEDGIAITRELMPRFEDGTFVETFMRRESDFNVIHSGLGFGRDSVEVFLATGCKSTIQASEDTFPLGYEFLLEPKSLPGGFGQAIVPGANLVTYGGGPVDLLAADLTSVGATSASASVDGEFVTYVVGAPSFVNSSFSAAFPGGVPASTVLIVLAGAQ